MELRTRLALLAAVFWILFVSLVQSSASVHQTSTKSTVAPGMSISEGVKRNID